MGGEIRPFKIHQRCPVVCRLAGFRGRVRRAVQDWYVRWRNRRILRASAWAARLCQEPSLDVLADINPFSIDELGEAIRRNADSCVGRAPSGHESRTKLNELKDSARRRL